MLLAARRYIGAVKHYVGEMSVHFQNGGVGHPRLPLRMYEQFVLLLNNAITASDYYYLGLYRRDIPWSAKRKYIGHYMLSRTYSCINPARHRVITGDKKIFHLLCMANELPVLDIVATYGPKKERAPWVCIDSLDELETKLQEPGMENIFLKPTTEQRGAGALALGPRLDVESWTRRPAGGRITLPEVIEHIKQHKAGMTWIIQRLASPSPFTAGIVENVVCTVRVVTINEGNPKILGAIMRFGDGDSPADNFEGGGVVALVDNDSGVLGPTLRSRNGLASFGTAHHRTGRQITGLVLPDWPKIKALVIDGAQRFSYFKCMGWDIAITDRGPIILEANSKSGFPSLQILTGKGLLEGPLGDVLRKNSGIEKSGINVPV